MIMPLITIALSFIVVVSVMMCLAKLLDIVTWPNTICIIVGATLGHILVYYMDYAL
jgi:hypothetical protein